ncbi:MAG: cell division protein FtsL [Clostridiales bacterium]|nr:cell division protein FtsL [Clostridiales bacterium]
MKKRRSFLRRHSISIGILVIVAIFSVASTLNKQELYNELKQQGETYITEIDKLERELKQYQEDLERVETLEFVEEYAREKLKMVSPNEIYFQIHYASDEE